MVPNKSQFCSQVPNFISKDVEKSRFRSRSRDFCQIFEGFGFEKFGLGKKVSVSVSEKFGLRKKSWFRFWKIWSYKKVLVSEKFRFGNKSRFRKICYRKKSPGFGFGKFGMGKKSRYRFRSKFWYRHSVSLSTWILATGTAH